MTYTNVLSVFKAQITTKIESKVWVRDKVDLEECLFWPVFNSNFDLEDTRGYSKILLYDLRPSKVLNTSNRGEEEIFMVFGREGF